MCCVYVNLKAGFAKKAFLHMNEGTFGDKKNFKKKITVFQISRQQVRLAC